MTTNEAKRAAEIKSLVDQIRRLIIDCTVEEKRAVVDAVNVWVSYEEAGHAQCRRPTALTATLLLPKQGPNPQGCGFKLQPLAGVWPPDLAMHSPTVRRAGPDPSIARPCLSAAPMARKAGVCGCRQHRLGAGLRSPERPAGC